MASMVVAITFLLDTRPHWPGFFIMTGSRPRVMPWSFRLLLEATLVMAFWISSVDNGQHTCKIVIYKRVSTGDLFLSRPWSTRIWRRVASLAKARTLLPPGLNRL